MIICAGALGLYVRMTPQWNFDVIVYTGQARIWLGETPEEAHKHVYEDLYAIAPKDGADIITSLSDYREHVMNDVEVFMTQLPIGAVKPLYVLLIASAVKLGANGIGSALAISALAYGGLVLVLLLALVQIVPFSIAMGIGLTLAATPSFLEIGRMPTPDALSVFISFAGIYILLFERMKVIGLALLLLSITARPDTVILCAAVAAWWAYRVHVREGFVFAVLAGVIYKLINWVVGGYSWGVLLTHLWFRRLEGKESVYSDVTVQNYLSVIPRALTGENVLYPSVVTLFGALSLLAWLMSLKFKKELRSERFLLISLWAGLVVHFIAYPMLADRFFIGYYAAISVLAVFMAARAFYLQFEYSSSTVVAPF
jgi:hypothetical protein